MKKSILFLSSILLLAACNSNKTENNKNETATEKTEKAPEKMAFFGEKFEKDGSISKTAMFERYNNLKPGDTIDVKFNSTVNSVCKKKGCWTKVALDENNEAMVRFKDYGFFLPMNSENSDITVNGKAFITEISVNELKHYAKDAGKSEEEIAKITEPKRTLAFEADGVILTK
ncbi:DUF4920 domain-containing protein [Aureivirga sp. CE67]|uniref:DUF4920 domain-containing protein n=1 Tax=Aureivirga sp. CE67 TaxID=1788983 RepID=UPI0018CA410B|nr:DUF4920 domain-containing protein [Aureivirga sp. CE67]